MQSLESKTISQELIFKISVLLLVLINLGLYSQSLYFDFFVLDDALHLHEKINQLQLSFENIKYFWVNSKMPVVYHFWQIIYSIFGIENAFYFRFFNIIVHSMNAVLLFKITYSLLLNIKVETKHFQNVTFAIIIATLFSIHPSQIESVIWISSLKGLLSAFFALTSIYIFISCDKKFLSLVFIFFTLSMLAKPTSIPILFLFPIINLITKKYKAKKLILGSLFLFIPAIMLSYYFLDTETDPTLTKLYSIFQIKDYILLFLQTNLEYLSKVFWPLHYSVDYGLSLTQILQKAYKNIFTISLTSIVFTAFSFVLFKFRKTKTATTLSLGVIIYLIFISLFTGLFPFSFSMNSLIADRYLYLPLIGVCIILSTPYIYFLNKKYVDQFYMGFLLVLFIFTYSSIAKWKSSEDILKVSLEYNPTSLMANMSLGKIYFEKKDYETSEKHFMNIINNEFTNIEARTNLFYVFNENPDAQKSTKNYIETVKIIGAEIPDFSHLYYTNLHAAGKYQEALDFITLQNKKFPDVLLLSEDLEQITEVCKSQLAECIFKN